jgi:hypothetical protein
MSAHNRMDSWMGDTSSQVNSEPREITSIQGLQMQFEQNANASQSLPGFSQGFSFFFCDVPI